MELRHLPVEPLAADVLLQLVGLVVQLRFQAPVKRKGSFLAQTVLIKFVLPQAAQLGIIFS